MPELSREQLLRAIRERAQHPASSRELMQLLDVPREQRAGFRRQLKALVADGLLVEVRGKRYGLADKMDLVVGRLQLQTGGFAFVAAEPPRDRREPDVFIAAPHLQEAMHGDRVVARVERLRGGDRPEGRIVKILERANQRIVGRFDVDAAGTRVRRAVRPPSSDRRRRPARRDPRRRRRARWSPSTSSGGRRRRGGRSAA